MPTNLLTVVIDSNPYCWGKLLDNPNDNSGATLSKVVDSITLFCDSFRLMSSMNKLMVLAGSSGSRAVIYGDYGEDNMCKSTELFTTFLSNRLTQSLSMLAKKGQTDSCETRLAAPLAQALCCTNRLRKETNVSETMQSRILAINFSGDSTKQHTSLMNIFFTAQKQHVLIDSLCVMRDSALMQQACDISGGVYMKISDMNEMLYRLMYVFLPDPSLRSKLNLPSSGNVDYRPACFCHQQLITIGWVCSVCLSVFCKFSPICATCQTVFKFIPIVPKVVKKRRVK